MAGVATSVVTFSRTGRNLIQDQRRRPE
jgi:hypothetical protein